MTPELSATPAPSLPSRRGWLIAFGIVEILIGFFSLLMLAMLLFSFLVLKVPYPEQQGALSRAALLTLSELLYGGVAAFFIVVGIGSIRCRNWARIAMIVVSLIWLVFGVLSTAGMAIILPFMPTPPNAAGDPTFHTFMVAGVIVMAVLSIVPPVIFLIFYTRKSVKATCLARSPAGGAGRGTSAPASVPASTKIPVPVIILVAWEAMGTMAFLSVLLYPATVLFGVVIRGLPAVLVMVTYSLMAGFAAWLIYRRDFAGWALATFKAGFGLASGMVTFARHDLMKIYQEMGLSEQQLQLFRQFPGFMPTIIWSSMILTTGVLIFLIYTRKYFPRSGNTASNTP